MHMHLLMIGLFLVCSLLLDFVDVVAVDMTHWLFHCDTLAIVGKSFTHTRSFCLLFTCGSVCFISATMANGCSGFQVIMLTDCKKHPEKRWLGFLGHLM